LRENGEWRENCVMRVVGLDRAVPSNDKAIEKIYSLWLQYPSSRRDEGIPIDEIVKDHRLDQRTTRGAFSILRDEKRLRIVVKNDSQYIAS
jgi:hypothetical protein